MNQQNQTEKKILLFFVPNFFTALNLACGFFSIIFALKGQFYWAAMIVIIGTLFDAMDGRLARLTGTQSAFGEQFDSMSDFLTFGVAPAFLFHLYFLTAVGKSGVIFPFIYVLCAALRLARFNANLEKVSSKYFQGLPSPSAALAIVGLTLFHAEIIQVFELFSVPRIVFGPYILFIGILMVTSLPFPSFKGSPWIRKRKKQMFLLFLVLFSALFLYEEIFVFAIIWTYIIFSLVFYIARRKHFTGVFTYLDEENESDSGPETSER